MTFMLNVPKATQALAQFACSELGIDQLAPDAHIALQIAPETWPLYAALQVNYGDPFFNSQALRARAKVVAGTLEERVGSASTTVDLKTLFEKFSKDKPDLLDAVIRGGVGDYTSNECPIALGGIFTFEDGRRARIHMDSRFMALTNVLPLSMDIYYHHQNRSLLKLPLNPHWREMESHCSKLRDHYREEVFADFINNHYVEEGSEFSFSDSHYAVNVSLDSPKKTMRVHLATTSILQHEVMSVNSYAPSKNVWSASQVGMHSFVNPQNGVPGLHSWRSQQDTTIQKDHLFFNPQKPNFLFMAGAVWMFKGIPFSINNLPFAMLGNFVTAAKAELQGQSSRYVKYEGPQALHNLNTFIPRGKRQLSSLTFHFDRAHVPGAPADLPFEWGIKGDNGVSIVSVPVTEATAPQTLAWMTREGAVI